MEQNHISITVGLCGGKPHIKGHRIRVQDIVIWHEKLGLSVDEIVLQFPDLSFSDVHAAMSYYFDNQTQIDIDIEQEKQIFQSFIDKHPSKLKAKLQAVNA